MDEPQMFNEACNHSNKESHIEWSEAIYKEFVNMNKQQVWPKMLKSPMATNGRCIKIKWVFKIKHNSVYQACLIA